MEANSKLDLENFLHKAPPTGSICTLFIKNNCPTDWGVVIIEGGARFWNRDGTDYSTGAIPLNLPAGAQDQLRSIDANKCVLTVLGACKVTIPGKPEQVLTAQSNAGADECAIGINMVIGPKHFAFNDDTKRTLGDEIEGLIELKVV